ncbi:MAG: chemotaxis protein CheW [Pseudomonas sp.]|jgi:purine-binding chemotaxis protein CheW|nr:chemotaxis protein CheW [Pseudomonas sp.]
MSNSQLEQILSQRQMHQQAIIDVDEPVIKLVIFSLDEQHFAFAGDAVKEVLPGTEAVFFVPGMPDSVEGVMNVRGDIESLIQLHTLLQLPNIREKSALHLTSILLARGKQMRSGLRVDRLLDVVDIPQSQVQPPPDALPEYLQTYVTGLLQFSGLAVAVLDIDALFSAWQKGQG